MSPNDPEPGENGGAPQLALGPRNLITDVPGLLVGHAQDEKVKSGTTVLTSREPFAASVDVMGGAPGSRETDCLAPERLIERIDALVLSGGSALGLDAASAVANELRRAGRGYPVGPVRVPIVPGAIIFDLLNGGQADWIDNLYYALGREALHAATEDFALGSVGAGAGATTATLKGGLGSASFVLPGGATVGALVVANPHGGAVSSEAGHFHAAAFEVGDEFGGLGVAPTHDPLHLPRYDKITAWKALQQKVAGDSAEERRTDGNRRESGDDGPASTGANTTIAIIATDARLDKPQLKRLAVAAQDGLARSLQPSHTPFDGDLVFALSTGSRELDDPLTDPMTLGHVASLCLARAVARGVYLAAARPGDTLPSWHARHGKQKR